MGSGTPSIIYDVVIVQAIVDCVLRCMALPYLFTTRMYSAVMSTLAERLACAGITCGS